MRPVTNFRSPAPVALRAVLPALALLLAAAAVVVPPAVDSGRVADEYRLASERAASARRVRTRVETLRAADFERRSAAAAETLDTLFPTETEPLGLFAATRVAASDAGVALTELVVGDPRDAEQRALGGGLTVREVLLRGEARPEGLVRLVERLRASVPITVRAVDLVRADDGREGFLFSMTLGALEARLATSRPAGGSGGQP